MSGSDDLRIKPKFNSTVDGTQSGESAKAEKKPEDIEISFNFDGNNSILDYTFGSNKEIKFEPVTKKELDKKIAIAKKILQLPNASEEELTKVRISLNLLPAGIMTSPDPELRGYARQDYYSFIDNITFTLDDKIAGIRTEKFLATPEGQKAADIAIEKIYKTLNSVEMPDYNKYGNVKKTLDQTVVHWFGTSVEEVWDVYHKSFDNVKTLRISKTKDPIAFARAYKSLTGTNFEPKIILAADELKEKCQQNYSGMVASEQILNKLKAGQETLKKGNSVENLNELKQQTLEICSLLSGQSAEEVEKELAKQFETINNKSFSKASEAEKADAYSKILNFYTADEKINSVKETYENFKKSYEKNNEEYKTLFKEAYGENKLSKAVQDNQEDIETAYTVTKVAVVIGATIATGGIAGAVGAGAVAGLAAAGGGAAFATAAIETTEKITDSDGLTWEETKNIGKEALIAGIFGALGAGTNQLGSVAKGASAKYFASTITQRAIGETVEFGTDVATSYLVTKAIGGETTWGSEAMQSGLPQLGFMVAGGFANRFARGAKGAMNAADSVDASAFKNISNVADGVDVSVPKNIDIEVDPKQAAEDLAAILGKPDIEVKDVPVAKAVQPAKDVPIAKATTDIPTSQKAKKIIPSSDLQTKLIACEPMTKFDLDILNKFANDNGLTLKIDKNIGDSKVALFTDSNGNVVRRVAENIDKSGTIYGDYLILYNGKQVIGGKIFFTGEAPVYYKKTKGEFIELESLEDLKSLCKPETKLNEIEPAKDTPATATPKPDEMPVAKAGDNIPKETPMLVSTNEKLLLGKDNSAYPLDLSSPEIKSKIDALKDGESLTVGRSKDADIQVPFIFNSTSRKHLTLTKQGDKLVVIDNSSYGTKVYAEQQKAKAAPVAPTPDVTKLTLDISSPKTDLKVVTATKSSEYPIPQIGNLRINTGAKVTYNAEGKIVCVEQVLSKGRTSKVSLEYSNGNTSKVDWQHSNGARTVAEYHPNTETAAKISEYSDAGKLERLTKFDANGVKTSRLDFFDYGHGRVTIYYNKSASDTEIYSFPKDAQATFDAEGRPAIIKYTTSDNKAFTDELVYSDDGNLVKIVTKNSDGKIVEKQKIYTQNDTIEVPELGEVKVSAGSKVYLDANDKITFAKIGDNQKIQIKYDEAGNISKIVSRKDSMIGLIEAKVFVRDANGKLVDKVAEHAKFVESRPDLFDDLQEGPIWAESVSANGAHTAWKMHLFSVDTQDYQLLADKVIPYLKENDIKYKTFSKRVCPEFLGSQQAGKAFTIYPHSNDEMAKVARDLDRIIKENNLTKADSKIVGDRQMGDSGRLSYRYELQSKEDIDRVFDLNTPDGTHDYHASYEKNRGGDNYLASDMKPEDDIWLKFNPSENPVKVADVAKAEAKPATLSPELAKIKAKQDKILVMLKDELPPEQYAKAKEVAFIEGRGGRQFIGSDIASLAKLSDVEFAKVKELFYIEARGDNQFDGWDIVCLSELSDAEFNKISKHLSNPNLAFRDFEQMAKYSPQNIENYLLLKDKGFTEDIADKIIQSIPVKTSKPVKTSAKPQSKYNIIEDQLKKSNLEFTDKMGVDADNLSKVIKIPLFSQHLALINNLSVEQVLDIYRHDKFKRQMSGSISKLSIDQKSALKNDGIDTDSLLQKLNAKSDAPIIKQPKVKQARTKQSLPEIEKQIIDKFNVPQEIYQDINKFNDFCKSKFEELINTEYTSKGFPESAEITQKRTDILNNWKKLFDEEDMDYKSRLLITSSITKDLEVGNISTPLQPSIQVANEIINAIDQGKNVSKALAKNATDSMIFSKVNIDGIEGEWVRIPSKINDPENFADNVNKLKALSLHNWCTRTFNAEPYLSKGDFYVFRSNGKTELGVRFEGKEIQEIQGFMNDRTIPLPFANIAKEFVESNNFKATSTTISDIAKSVSAKPEFDTLKIEVEQSLKDKNYKGAFEKLGIEVMGERNGKLIIKSNKLPSDLYRVQDFKGGNDLWEQVCEVKDLSLEQVNTIRNLDVIDGKPIPWDILK